jgi:serine phosphatase RsbU (regulator of sigma subunit)
MGRMRSALRAYALETADPADILTRLDLDPQSQRSVTAVPIPSGALLVFFTDGLVERPGQLIDDGIARLCHAAQTGPPESVCAAVMGALVGSEPSRDDIALLVIRRVGATGVEP